MKVFCVIEVITDAGRLSKGHHVELRRVCKTLDSAKRLIGLLEEADTENGVLGAYVISEDEVYE